MMKNFRIERPQYIHDLLSYKDTELIKILTGVRRCGKSTVLEMYAEELKMQGVAAEQIQHIKLEELENSHLSDYRELHRYVLEHIVQGKQNYVILDEVQNVAGFEKAVRSLYEKGNIDLYLTGSNSRLQTGEWATLLAGRYVEIPMFPLSFREFLSIRPTENLDKAYAEYLQYSSFPYAQYFVHIGGTDVQKQVTAYLSGLFDTVVLRDVAEKRGLSNVAQIRRIMQFMASAIGSPISIKRVSDMLATDGIKISPATLDNYTDAFRQAYIWYRADRFDVKGRKVLKTLNKYYLVDPGLRHFMLGNRSGDSGHVLENVVYLELLRRGYRVYIGKISSKASGDFSSAPEVDFVAETPNGIVYYQVSDSVNSPETLRRELVPLQLIRDNYPKILLSRNYGTADYNGIRSMNVLEWMNRSPAASHHDAHLPAPPPLF